METGDRPKTNKYCEFNEEGRCTKIMKPCNNTSNFYEECNTFKGNKSLSVFL